jgi:hypothetical protein
MIKRRVLLFFPSEIIREPIIYTLGQDYRVMTNIFKANISENEGWLELELAGDENQISEGISWMISRGVRVETVV